jgi:transposase
MRYDLTEFEWSVIEPVLPKGRPGPKCKDDRRVMNGTFWVLRGSAICRAAHQASNRTMGQSDIDGCGGRI